MKTIVVGYDGSEEAERALARAADVAQAFSARLVVISVTGLAHVPVGFSAFEPAAVLVPPAATGPVATGGTVPLPESQPEPSRPGPEELARHELERARMSLASRPVEAEYVVEVGDPVERLLDVADQRDAPTATSCWCTKHAMGANEPPAYLSVSTKNSNRNEGTRSLTTNAVGIRRQAERGADGCCAVGRLRRVVGADRAAVAEG